MPPGSATPAGFVSKILLSLAAVSALLLNILLFIPFTIYSGNASEFTAGFFNMQSWLLAPGLLALAAGTLVVALLPEVIFSRALSLLIGFSVALILQSSVLVWDYGLLDGSDIEWNKFKSNGFADIALWTLAGAGSVLFSRRIEARTLNIVVLLFMFNILGAGIAFLSFEGKWFTPRQSQQSRTLFSFSPVKNVIMIVLDAFEAPAFQHIIDQDPAYRDTFRDFSFFKNTLGQFPTTAPSIPVMLSGQVYDNSEALSDFVARVLPAASLPSVLLKNGFQADMVTLPHFCQTISGAGCLSLPAANQLDYSGVEREELYRLIDLSLFRGLPQPLRRRVYNHQNWFLQQRIAKRIGPRPHINTIEFVENVLKYADTSADRPAFKFFHLALPHTPIRLDAACNYSHEYRQITVRDFSMQARCALLLAKRITARLQELGVYDSALIVVLADHGFKINYGYYPRSGPVSAIPTALPLLLIKLPGQKGEFQISEVPANLSDVARTMAEIIGIEAGFPGINILELNPGDQRERIFRNYSWVNDDWQKAFLPPMQEYRINGHAWDPAAWSKGKRLEPPKN